MKIYFLLFLALLFNAIFCDSNEDNAITIGIVASSDMHGHIYPWDYATDSAIDGAGFAQTNTIIQELKNKYPNNLLIDVGDLYQENLAEIFLNNETHPMIQALYFLNYDVWVLGNHDFNFGLDILERNIKNFKGKAICSNIKYEDTGNDYLPPYHIFEIKGVRVAIIGAITPLTKLWEAAYPEHYKNLDFINPIDSIKAAIESIKDQYDILVGAFHISRNGENDADPGVFEIAEKIPEFDVIFAGHEHALYTEKINNTWVLEPGVYGANVAFAKFDLKKDEDGNWKLENCTAETISTKGAESSENIMKEFEWVHNISINYINRFIGELKSDFIEGVDYITGKDIVTTMPRAQIEDTALMDFINEVQTFYAKSEVSACALFNINQNVKKGPLKRKDIINIYKYDNTLRCINITGENLLKYMENNVRYYQTIIEGDVTISFNPKIRAYSYDLLSGINFDIDISQPEGSRIKNATIKGKPVDKNAIYKLAVNNYRFGELVTNNWATYDDIYYNSDNDVTSTIRDFIIKYIEEELNGVIEPSCDYNWKIIGLPNSFNDTKTIEKIKNGEITIEMSSDGRTPNIKAITLDTNNDDDNDDNNDNDNNDDNNDFLTLNYIFLFIFIIACLFLFLKI